MIKKELDKLTNDEKLVIVYWRIIEYPRQLNVPEIAQRLCFPPDFVFQSIKKFEKNVRLGLEMKSQHKKFKALLEFAYYDDKKPV